MVILDKAIAKAASVIGPKTRSKGGSLLKTGKTPEEKSKGSKMMKVTDVKVEKGLKQIRDNTLQLPKMLGKFGKFIDGMAKSSPALKQQLIVLNKSMMLFLRPIGDIMAKFVRPMAIWTITVAKKWYNKFGASKEGGSDDPEDKLKQLKDTATLLETTAPGSPEAIEARKKADEAETNIKSEANLDTDPFVAYFDTINDKVAEMNAIVDESALGKATEMVKEFFDSLLSNYIKEAWTSFIDLAKSLGTMFVSLYDAIKPVLNVIMLIVKTGLIVVFAALALAFKGLTVIINVITVTLKMLTLGWATLKAALVILIEYMPEIAKSIADWAVDVWDNIKKTFAKVTGFFETVIAGIKKAFTGIYDAVIRIVNKVPGVNIPLASMAVGGAIDTTGLYTLHAGERVITAGDTSRMNDNSQSINVTNNFVVNATLNSDFDIQELAARLAELNETELRRRVSYI